MFSPKVSLPRLNERVDADAPALEVVVRRRAVLIEVVEGDTVGVVLAAARDVQVVVRNRRRVPNTASHQLVPVLPGMIRCVRVGILGWIHADRPPERVGPGHRAAAAAQVYCGNGRVVGVSVDVGRDRQPRVQVALLDDLEVVERVRR